MGVGAGLCMYDVVVKKFTSAISSPDECLVFTGCLQFPVINQNEQICYED